MKYIPWIIFLFLAVAMTKLSINFKDWIANNTSYLAIIISLIASLSALASVVFNIIIFNIKNSQKEIRITLDTQTPIFNKANGKWLMLKIHNYGNIAAKNPRLTLYIENKNSFTKVYHHGFAYTMYPHHYFNFHLMKEEMPLIQPKDRLLAKVEYTNTSNKKNEVESIPFMISEVVALDANTGNTQDLVYLTPTCAEFESYNDPLINPIP